MGFGKKSNKIEAPPIRKGLSQPEMFALVRRTFDEAGWKYEAKTDKYAILTSFMGDDLPIAAMIRVDEGSVHFSCLLDLEVPMDKYSEICWNLNEINANLKYGSFTLDSDDGKIMFNYGMVFVESNFSVDFIKALVRMVVNTVDEYDGELKKITVK